MGFLAFLVIGGASGACAWMFYPGLKSPYFGFRKPLGSVAVGVLASIATSYLGQFGGFFQAGQMLQWLCVVLAASVASCIYVSLVN